MTQEGAIHWPVGINCEVRRALVQMGGGILLDEAVFSPSPEGEGLKKRNQPLEFID